MRPRLPNQIEAFVVIVALPILLVLYILILALMFR